MEASWSKKENNQFLNAILALESKDEAKRFLRDLMTSGEIEEFGKRLEAARLLSRDTQYASIIELTGLSSTTIARISKWLKGSLGGYRLILSRISNHHHNPTKLGKGLSLTRN
ncbi:MAG: YerC/YecD family TrpR-related protein [Patescibacteria group bacterium]